MRWLGQPKATETEAARTKPKPVNQSSFAMRLTMWKQVKPFPSTKHANTLGWEGPHYELRLDQAHAAHQRTHDAVYEQQHVEDGQCLKEPDQE